MVAVADRSYAALEPLHAVRQRVCMVPLLLLVARLFDSPPQRTIGRPRVVGARQPSLAQRLARPETPGRRLAVADLYGGCGRTLGGWSRKRFAAGSGS